MKSLDCAFIDDHSEKYRKNRNVYQNNPDGLHKLITDCISLCNSYGFTKIQFGYEPTNNYGFHIPFYINDDQRLSEYTIEIYQINPKIIKHFRKSFSERPKTDKEDGLLIAERLKARKLPPYCRFDPKYFALRTLTRQRFDIVMRLVSEKSKFLSHLFIKASAFLQNPVFSNTFGATSISLLTEFNSVDEIINTPMEELAQMIITRSKNKIKDPQKYAALVNYVARESYKINRVMHDSINYTLLASHRHIKFLNGEVKKIDKEIEAFVKAFSNQYKILTSIKGIGPVTAAGIIAELGDISLFASHKQVAKFAGLIWRIKESGKFKAKETSLTKSGNRYLRYYLVQAAQILSYHNSDFKSYYAKKWNEATKYKHKRAVLMLARKLVRVIVSLLKNNKLYESPA